MPNVLHITTHMGGGAGRAIDAMACYERRSASVFSQTILLLEEPKDTRFVDHCKAEGVPIFISPSAIETERLLREHDIVLVSWWNHPLMQKFLSTFPRVPIRLAFWIHVNANAYPILPFAFADLAQRILITTPCTAQCPVWTGEQRGAMDEKMRLVYGMGAMDMDGPVKKTYRHDSKFRIAYLGTIQYEKLHPQFPLFCKEVKKQIPSAEFVMLGKPGQEVVNSIVRAGLQEAFIWKGFVDHPEQLLPEMDVFGYPLTPFHFGSTENSILEAMVAGLPVVVLNQSAEASIICDGVNGLLANTPEEYGAAMKHLAEDEALCAQLGENGRKFIMQEYRLDDNMRRYRQSMADVLENDKTIVDFRKVLVGPPHQWFLDFCDMPQRKLLMALEGEASPQKQAMLVEELPAIFKAKSKSSVHHFAETYTDDNTLARLDNLINLHSSCQKRERNYE